jgi:hypothetical protein
MKCHSGEGTADGEQPWIIITITEENTERVMGFFVDDYCVRL